jgi:predicted enzyme related to lactoylglutathione lyase
LEETSREQLAQEEQSTSSKAVTVKEGHIFIPVQNLSQALRFYRDLLGIQVTRSRDDWIDLAPVLRLSLSREEEELIEFHVEDFEEAAASLEEAGVKVERKNRHHGRISDPSGNIIGIHDHRK